MWFVNHLVGAMIMLTRSVLPNPPFLKMMLR